MSVEVFQETTRIADEEIKKRCGMSECSHSRRFRYVRFNPVQPHHRTEGRSRIVPAWNVLRVSGFQTR